MTIFPAVKTHEETSVLLQSELGSESVWGCICRLNKQITLFVLFPYGSDQNLEN